MGLAAEDGICGHVVEILDLQEEEADLPPIELSEEMGDLADFVETKPPTDKKH